MLLNIDYKSIPYKSALSFLYKILIVISVISLPFTQAFTINWHFPLKIYEVTLSLCIYFFIIKSLFVGRIYLDSFTYSALCFWGLALISFTISMMYSPPEYLTFIPRFGYSLDGITKLLYLLFAILSYVVIHEYAKQNPILLTNAWMIGAVISASYLFYTAVMTYLGYHPIRLPGIERQQLEWFWGHHVARSGTFLEGNFGGLFFLLSMIIALYRKKFLLAVFFFFSVLLTRSTVTILATVIVFFILFVKGEKKVRLFSLVLLLFIVSLISYLPYIHYIINDKLNIHHTGSSLQARLNTGIAAYYMFLAHPIWGVGISHYGYYFKSYLEWPNIYALLNKPGNAKPIVNNIYLEILSENGIIGFIFFTYMLFQAYNNLKATNNLLFYVAGLAILIVFNAFPTYTICYLWAFIAIVPCLNFSNLNNVKK